MAQGGGLLVGGAIAELIEEPIEGALTADAAIDQLRGQTPIEVTQGIVLEGAIEGDIGKGPGFDSLQGQKGDVTGGHGSQIK
jgi:hypothetical protein